MQAPKTGGFSWDPENRESVTEIAAELKAFNADSKAPSMSELFLLCVVLGWNDGFRKPVKAVDGKIKENNVPYKYFSEQAFNMLISIALAELEDAQALLDEAKIFRLLEEYGAGGLAILCRARSDGGKLENWLRSEFVEFVNLNTKVSS